MASKNLSHIIGADSNVNESHISHMTKNSGEKEYYEIENWISNVMDDDKANNSMSSASRGNNSNSMISQDIWASQCQQDPNIFEERYTTWKTEKKEKKQNLNFIPKNQLNKLNKKTNPNKKEDYNEDDIDENTLKNNIPSFQTIDKNNILGDYMNVNPAMMQMNKKNTNNVIDYSHGLCGNNQRNLNNTRNACKKPQIPLTIDKDPNKLTQTHIKGKQNTGQKRVMEQVNQNMNSIPNQFWQPQTINNNNITFPPQFFSPNKAMASFPNIPGINSSVNPQNNIVAATPIPIVPKGNEYNVININIAPTNTNTMFTQNIYMNFPPGANVNGIINNANQMYVKQPTIAPFNPLMQAQHALPNNKINWENIIIGTDKRTTLMLRNIPNKYTLANVVDELGNTFWGKVDCVSLPIDYDTKLNWGYSFINFTDPLHIIHFYSKFYLRKWSKYKSEKKMDMTYADKQGKKDLTLKADNNYFAEDDKRFDFATLKPYVEIPCRFLDFFKKIYPTSVCVTKDLNYYNDNYFIVKSFGKTK